MRTTWETFSLLFIPKFKLGIGIDLGFGGSKGSSSGKSTTELDKTTTASETKTGFERAAATSKTQQSSTGATKADATKTAEGVETSFLSTLDVGTQNTLKNLMNDLASEGAGNQALLSLLESRAFGSDEAFAGLVDPQVEEARRRQEQDLGGTVQALSRATGGGAKSNSLVAGFDLEGQRAIDTSIASLAATLGIDARQAATEEISGAFGAGLASEEIQTSAVVALGEVLKGAEQKGTKVTDATESVQSIEDVMQALTSATTEDEVKLIIENLFSTEDVFGTEVTKSSGNTSERSIGLGLTGGGLAK